MDEGEGNMNARAEGLPLWMSLRKKTIERMTSGLK